MEYFVISAKFVPLKYYTLSLQLRRLTSYSVGLFGSANSVTRSYPVMRKSCIPTLRYLPTLPCIEGYNSIEQHAVGVSASTWPVPGCSIIPELRGFTLSQTLTLTHQSPSYIHYNKCKGLSSIWSAPGISILTINNLSIVIGIWGFPSSKPSPTTRTPPSYIPPTHLKCKGYCLHIYLDSIVLSILIIYHISCPAGRLRCGRL